MIRLLVLLLGILPAIASAYYVGPAACYGPNHPWGAGDFLYPPAQSYCSNHFPPKTVTKTATAPTLTVTSTVATRTSTQVLPGVITSVVATAPATTSTVFATVFMTSTVTITSTLSTTSTSTSTVTVVSTTSVRAAPPVKRAVEPTGAQAFKELLSKGRPVIEQFCSCVVTGQVTKTVTTTPRTTVRATATTTTSVSSVFRTTFTPTVTTTSTFTAAAAPETVTTATTSTSVEVATTTTTSVTTVVVSPPSCNPNAAFGQQGAGGCSSNCFCDRDIDGVNNYCDSSVFCLGDCQSDNDCAIDQFCATGTSCSSTGGRTCQKYSDCTSSFVPILKRSAGLDAVPVANQMPARAIRAKDTKELSHLLNLNNHG